MARCSTVLTLVLVVLAHAASARAQPDAAPPAMQGAFTNEPEPVAGGPEFCPDPKPAGGGGWAVPFGPKFDFFNAFTTDCHGPEYCVGYGGVGVLALSRQRLGSGIVAVTDPGTTTSGITTFSDTGNVPPAGSPRALGFGDVQTNYNWGVMATVGRRLGPVAIEATGFYLPWTSNSITRVNQAALDLPFGAYTPPAGFEGNNNLWLQADQVVVTFQSRLSSAEVNARFGSWLPGIEGIVGVRYLDEAERLSIYTGDEDIALAATPQALANQATYTVNTFNQIVGPQVGFQAETFLIPSLSLSLVSKNMVGPNFWRTSQSLVRGDGFQGPSGNRSGTQASAVFELNALMSLWLNDHIRFRAGWIGLWAVNVPEAAQQVNFNPNIGGGSEQTHGSIFYQGPMLDLQLAF